MRFYEISQTLLHRLNTTFDIHELTQVIDKLEPHAVSVYVKKFNEPVDASWGTGLYELLDDGRMILVDSYWDTSD